jgi:aminopeptidase N
VLTRIVAASAVAAVVLGGMAGLSGASGSGARPVAGAPGIGDPYFPEDGNGGIDVLSYDVHDAYRFSDQRLRGWTVVRLRTSEPLTSFDLDFLLPVRSVRLSTGPARFSRPDRHELRITPPRPLPTGTVLRATIAYRGHPGRVGWDGEHSWLADRHEVVAMNEPHMAPWWFPANDHPLDKARMDLHLTVPSRYRVIANGLPAGTRHRGSHTTYHWTGGGPMASYLAFFAAGRFTVRRGTSHGLPWYVAVSRQLTAAGREVALRTLLRTPEIVNWLRKQLGRYPFSSTGGLITALQPGFALENQTRPTYPAWVTQTTLVHELAHQWFGDSVSVHHWRDVWLNEGFASFMERLWTEDHGGQTAQAWLRQTYRSLPPDDSFWHLDVADPGRAHLFDWPVYQRGAMALQALRHRLGDSAFRRLLRTWVSERRYGHGTVGEFEALAEQVSRRHLTSFFDTWLRSPAKPADTAADGL